jgi:hypothetical protein
MKKKLAVIGVGTAGIQSLAHFLAWLPPEWEVTSIYDPNIPIIGIGESTNPGFVNVLEFGADFKMGEDLGKIDGSLKYGTKYFKWRKKSFISPLFINGVAIHFDNFKLKEFTFSRFREIWQEKFKELHGNVTNVKNLSDHVSLMVDGKEYSYDYLVDCTGFPKDYNGYTLIDKPTVNRGLIYNDNSIKISPHGPYYTFHTATKNGWMFTIPLPSRTSYGYLFNDSITSVEEAKEDFAEILEISNKDIGNIEYKFDSYYKNKVIENRVCYNGNKSFFFEPLFANSLWIYDKINKSFFDYIFDIMDEDKANSLVIEAATDIEHMIAFHYQGGSTIDTPFWQYVSAISKEKMNNFQKLKNLIPELKELYKNKIHKTIDGWVFDPYGLSILDKKFEYYYFTNRENE